MSIKSLAEVLMQRKIFVKKKSSKNLTFTNTEKLCLVVRFFTCAGILSYQYFMELPFHSVSPLIQHLGKGDIAGTNSHCSKCTYRSVSCVLPDVLETASVQLNSNKVDFTGHLV